MVWFKLFPIVRLSTRMPIESCGIHIKYWHLKDTQAWKFECMIFSSEYDHVRLFGFRHLATHRRMFHQDGAFTRLGQSNDRQNHTMVSVRFLLFYKRSTLVARNSWNLLGTALSYHHPVLFRPLNGFIPHSDFVGK